MSWGAVIGAGASIVGGMINKKGTKKAAEQATPVPYGVTGPAGSMSVNGKNLSLTMGNNPFAPMFQGIGASSMANAATAPGSPLYGASPEIVGAYNGLFGQGMNDQITNQLGLLRGMAAPEENRQYNRLQDRLQTRGTTDTTTGTEEQRAFDEASNAADLQRQFQAQAFSRQQALDRFQGALEGTGSGMAGQQQQFGIANLSSTGWNDIFGNLLRQANLGLGAASGTPSDIAMAGANANNGIFASAWEGVKGSGILDRFNNPSQTVYPGGGVPVVNQPGSTPNVYYPQPNIPMPSGDFGL